jgi:orotidine-5'-phosphate decarboxylase
VYTRDLITLALDGLNLQQCLSLVSKVGQRVKAVKIHSLWDAEGPGVVKRLLEEGARSVFVDLKFDDIPETVKLRASAVEAHGASTLTVHIGGEIEMMIAAREGAPKTVVYGITVLTSLDEDQTHLSTGQPVKAAVLYRARLAKLAGINGVVCSPKEVGMLSKRLELRGLRFVTPGIRSAGKKSDDQKRFDTPVAALEAGSSELVIGRQITKAENPEDAVSQLEEEISVYYLSKRK